MSKYKTYSVEVYIEEGSDLEQRIQALADRNGEPFEETLTTLSNISIKSWMRSNAEGIDRFLAKKKQ